MFKKLKQRYINRKLLKIAFRNFYQLYEYTLSDGFFSFKILKAKAESMQLENDTKYAKLLNKELNLIVGKMKLLSYKGKCLSSDLIREIYLTYGVFKEALK